MKFNGKGLAGLLALSLLFSFSGCSESAGSAGVVENLETSVTEDTAPVTLATETTVVTTTTEPVIPPDISVNLLAVGDNLVQSNVYLAAQVLAGGAGYNFGPVYENVKPIIQAADVAIINQETLICGGDYEISGTNFNFNSPVELGDAMVDLGFDIFTTANNHMLDKGVGGLASSLDYWDGMMQKYPILTLGAYRNQTDQETIRVQYIKGMRIAYLSYAEHLNGYSLPEDTEIRIGMTYDRELIERQIKRAKEVADAVVVAMHWDEEDTTYIREDVKELAQDVVNWGADVIIGTHSHTAETMEYLTRPDGTRGFVFYSLGNFICAQTDNFNVVGEMSSFNLVKHGDTGAVTVEDIGVMPVITHYDAGYSNLRLYPYNMYTAELANAHALPYTHAYPETAKDFGMDTINRIVNENIPAEFQRLDSLT